MMYHLSRLSYGLKKLLPLFLLSLLFACKKDIKTKEQSRPVDLAPTVTSGPDGTNCYDYHVLTPQPDGTLTGFVEDVPIRISSYVYQAYDDNGNPITYMDGDPFWGSVSITSNTPAEVLYNSANPQDDQFVIRVYQMGAVTVDLSGYRSALSSYFAGEQTAIANGTLATYLFDTKFPNLGGYISQAQGSYHDVAGRLIRINPQQVQRGTDALGNPIFVTTTFAWAPTCYPRNGLRPGQTTANISLRNAFSPQPNNLTISFIKDGIVYRQWAFPSTYGTTSAAQSIPGGTYTVRITKSDLNYQYFSLGSAGYWEVQAGQDCSGGLDIGTANISPGNYTLIGTSFEP